jgi:translocation and assembly module TamB
MRKLRIVLVCAAGAITLLVAMLAGLVLVGGNTERGRDWIERLTDRLSAGQVRISGLQGSFPAQLTIDELRLSDANGVWLTAEHLRVRWSPWALLARRVDVHDLEVAHVAFERLPIVAPSQTGPTSIPIIEIAQAAIAELQLGPAVAGVGATVSLRGTLLLRSLEDASGNVSARRIGADGSYDLQFRFDRQRMDGRLQLHEPAEGPLENFLQLPGLGALSATATINGARGAEHLELIVDAGNLHGSAHGDINLIDASADLEYAVTGAQMQLRPDLGWQSIGLHGFWHGPASAARADGELHLDRLRLPGGWAVGDLNAHLAAASGTLTVAASASQLQIPGPNPQLLARDPVEINATLGLTEPTRPLQLRATTRLLALEAQAPTAGPLSASLTLRINDLRPVAALAGEDLRGTALVKAEVSSSGAGMQLSVDANGALDHALPETPAGWRKVLGDRPALQLSALWSERSIEISRLQLSGHTIEFALHGDASRAISGAVDGLGLHWNMNLTDLGEWSAALAGHLSASGELRGPMTDLSADASLQSSLSVQKTALGTITGSVQIHGLPGAASGRIQLAGLLDDAPLQFDLGFDRGRDGSLHALIRRGEWRSARLQGEMTIGPANASGAAHPQASAQTRGRLELQVAQLGDLEHLLGQKLDGDADLSGEGVADAVNLQLRAHATKIGGEPATLSAAASLNLEKRTLRLTGLELESRQQTLQLAAPAMFSFADGLSVDRLQLSLQQSNLRLSGRLLPSLDLHASLQQVGPAFVNAFMPDLLAGGSGTAEAELTGTLSKPIGQIRIEADGIRFESDAATGLPAAALHADLRLEADTLSVDAKLSAGKNSQLTITGTAPLDQSGLLGLRLDGKLDIGLVSPLLEARGLQAAGDLEVAVRVGGSAIAPDIGGTIRVDNASLRDYVRGINLSDISAQFSGSQGALKVDRFTAHAAAGTLALSGTVGFLQPRIPVDLKLTADHAQAIANSLITANLDAALQIKGTALDRLDLVGSVQIHRATIGIPSALPPNVAVLDVRRRGRKAPRPLDPQLVIGLNIAVHAPNEILVQGRGLDAELGGDLQVGGTVDAPAISGGFDLQRGSFSIAGSSLPILAPGHVRFDGAGLKSKLDPTLDFTAQKIVTDATVTLNITGLADAPKFDFSSTPPMPQEEILARLLFGVPTSQLTPLMVAQIGAALAVLSIGGDGGFNPLVKLQKSLGLDRLNFGSNATAGSTATASGTGTAAPGSTATGYNVAAGRYIAKRVYVEAKQSTTGSTQLQVDVDLTKHLKLQTRLGNGTAITQGMTPDNDPGSSIGLSYQIEY